MGKILTELPLSWSCPQYVAFLAKNNRHWSAQRKKLTWFKYWDSWDIVGYGVALLEPLHCRSGITHRYTRQHEGHSWLNVRQFMRANQDLWRHTYKEENGRLSLVSWFTSYRGDCYEKMTELLWSFVNHSFPWFKIRTVITVIRYRKCIDIAISKSFITITTFK